MDALLQAAASLDTRWLLAGTLAVLDAWCIGLLVLSESSRRSKVLWTGIILLCPIVGCILWYVLGPKPDMLPEEEPDGDAPADAEA